MATPLAGRSFLATFGMVFLAIAGLFAADTFLARMDRRESATEAERLFAQGKALMQRGEDKAAEDRINDAIAIDRSKQDYLQTLAQAQLAGGESSSAEATLAEILNSDSTDGVANLVMGRVLIKEGRYGEATSYFHRAIYGHWKVDAEGNRRRARLELIDLLAQQNSKEELLAELLPIQDDAPQDVETRTHLGELFLRAGSPSRAASVFRAILHKDPNNAAAYKGMGEAEFAQGDYRAAQREFLASLRIRFDDVDTKHRLDLCNELLQLDPTLRGLGANERYGRSHQLLELAQNELSQCLNQAESPEQQALLLKAAAALKARVNAAQESEVAEANLDTAEQLWQLRKKECKTPAPTDSPLALVMARLAR